LKIEKCMSTSAAAKQLVIHIWTAYKWISQHYAWPDSIFEDCNKVGRRCTLTVEHKTTVMNFIDTISSGDCSWSDRPFIETIQ
jgi:hypothetical protein